MPTDSDSECNDDNDNELVSKPGPSRGAKRYRTESDQENNSYSSSESINENTKSVQTSDNNDSTSSTFFDLERRRQPNVSFMYHCSFCYYQTAFRYGLKIHGRNCKQSEAKRLWECRKCSIRYSLAELLDEHSIPEDPTSLDKHIFHCPMCSLEADKRSEVPILDRIYPFNRHYICPSCKAKIIGPRTYRQHLMKKHCITLRYRCEYCDFSSLEVKNLLEHKKSHADLQEMGLIQCSHCRFEFFTMREVKIHMKRVKWEREGKEMRKVAKKETEEVLQRKRDSLISEELEEERMQIEPMDDVYAVERENDDIGNWQLRCTLCQYVNYSKSSCQRHVKNKHRPSGHTVVKFDKYYEGEFKGSVDIGKVKGGQDAEQTSAQELLKILDWTQSDEEHIPEEIATDNVDSSEVITIEMASDTEDEENEEEKIENRNDYKISKIKENTAFSQNANKKELDCMECNYKAKNKLHLSIHQQLIHEVLDNNYKCPQRLCTYASKERARLRSHLKRYHKLHVEVFYPSEMKCPDCVYTAKKPHHLRIHRTNAHKNGSPANQHPKKDLQKDADKSEPPTNVSKQYSQKEAYKSAPMPNYPSLKPLEKDAENIIKKQKIVQTGVKYSKLSCKQCGVEHKEMYKLAWHMLKSHNNKSELRKWRLKCKECNYENHSKLECHKHGMQHKVPHVKFQKYYLGKLKGAIGFRYQQDRNHSADSQKSKLQPDIVETQKNLLQSKEEAIDDKKVPTEAKEEVPYPGDENVVDKAERVENKPEEVETDILLEKKEEFFTCSQCIYEVKNESYLPLHRLLVHGAPISVGKARYNCQDCSFKSKYRHSLKRHLEGVHSYDTEVFYTKEQGDLAVRKPIRVVAKDNAYKCRLCNKKFQDKYQRDWHIFKLHRDKTDLLKWSIQCSLCNFENWSKKSAQLHAAVKHSNLKRSVIVKFEKYYENEPEGCFEFTIGKGELHYCTKCNYVASTSNYLRQHYRNHNMQKDRNFRRRRRFRRDILELNSVINIRNNTEEVGSSNEIDQDEIIRIEIAPDSEDYSNESQDLSENEEEFEQYEEFNVSKHSKRKKANVDKNLFGNEDVALGNEDKGNNTENLSGNDDVSDNDEKIKQNEEHSKNSKRHRSTRRISLKSDNESNKIDSSKDHERLTDAEEDMTLSRPSNNLRSSRRQRSTGIRKISFKGDDEINKSDEDANNNESDDEYVKGDERYGKNKQNRDLSEDLKEGNVSFITNNCMFEGCNYKSSIKFHLKRHCLKVHRFCQSKLDEIFFKLIQYECNLCKFQSSTRKEMNTHMGMHKENSNYMCTVCTGAYKNKYQLAVHMFTAHRDDTELLKWDLRCTLCSYKHHWAKYASRHGMTHSDTTQPVTVKFQKFYNNMFVGTCTYHYGIRKLHQCSKCDYVTGTWECLNKHLERHKKTTFVPQYQTLKKKAGQKWLRKEGESAENADQPKSWNCSKCRLISDKFKRANHLFEAHRDTTEIYKCYLGCTKCNYETHYSKYAYKHGQSHSSTKKPTTVRFKRMYEDNFEGFFVCRYDPITLHQCDFCHFVTSRWESLKRHLSRHKNKTPKFKTRYKTVTKEGTNKKIGEGAKRLKKGAKSFVDERKTKGDNQTEPYSKQQIWDIIGLISPEIKKKQDNSAVKFIETEKDVNQIEENSEMLENNEVITIEITPGDNTFIVNKRGTKTATLNPFSGVFVTEESGDEDHLPNAENMASFDKSQNFKCSKIDCEFSSDNLKELTDHVELCQQDILLKNRKTKSFTCFLCEEVLSHRSSLQRHSNIHAAALNNPDLVVSFSEFTNEIFTCDIEIKANIEEPVTNKDAGVKRSGRTFYKCSMCGGVIITKTTLKTHTNLHAREDENLNLKVRYSKFLDDKLEGTIVMHADGNYVPPKRKQAKSPEPQYDPSLPVFSCEECNFKTNDEEALNKHKTLHWSLEKETLYKAQKWFTCSVCFFHCFDLEKYKEHCEWHKTHYSGTGDIEKLGKNSWFLK